MEQDALDRRQAILRHDRLLAMAAEEQRRKASQVGEAAGLGHHVNL
jgi:hypothetical protein